MATYVLTAKQFVPADLDRTWAFFSDPANLARLTPPSMGFVVHSAPSAMHEGQLIDYTVRPLLGIPARWQTRIDSVEPKRTFTDTQLRGPYRRWVHSHRFTAVEGGTLVEDRVEYRLPFGPLGRLAHALAVRARLEEIFRYREAAIQSLFAPAGPAPSGAKAPVTVVAGGTGFVGGAIAGELRKRGDHVIVLSSRGASARGWLPDDVEIRTADASSGAGLPDALKGADRLVISLAFPGLPIENRRRGYTFEAVDAAGTERLVAAAKAAGIKQLLYVSGAGAAPDARRHWFRAKWRAEEAVRSSGISWTILRPTWVFGPRDVSLNRFLGFARTLPFVPMTNFGSQRLAPIFVGDVAGIAADALASDAGRDRVFEIGGPEILTMRQIISKSLRVAGLRRPLLPAPAFIVKAAAAVMSLLPNPPLTPSAVDFVNQPATVDTAPLLAALPRRLTSLEEGLAGYVGSAGPNRSEIHIQSV